MNKILQTEFFQKDSEVTEEIYYHMLGTVPPRIMRSNAFLVGEPVDHDAQGYARYELYFEDNGKFYYGGKASVSDFLIFCVPDMSLINCDTIESKAWEQKAKAGEVMRII